MKKIMFNDHFLLTQAVLEGRKTQTRRIIDKNFFSLNWDIREDHNGVKTLVYENDFGDFIDIRQSKFCHYKLGEIVAVAQNYKDAGVDLGCLAKDGDILMVKSKVKGYSNKMFVKPELMPHQVRITNVRVQKLQEITNEECIVEGVKEIRCEKENHYVVNGGKYSIVSYSPRIAYSQLIDKISRNGTWENNPWVFAYDFELVKRII
jgi:hypothetical protein|nr:MAG TPA: ASCH domain protein [Caudoviricetes sp.]DAX20590.1 MAG TPA: ASCH domain protein [Caudoviricetes sp.]